MIRFLVWFVALQALLFGLELTPWAQTWFVLPWTSTLAAVSADIVKVFPADIGGPAYLKALRGPLPQVRLMPTGGVSVDNVATWIKAGAVAVGLFVGVPVLLAIECGRPGVECQPTGSYTTPAPDPMSTASPHAPLRPAFGSR